MPPAAVPAEQTAVQLVGPDQLALNTKKPIHRPGPTQILGQVECVGLCQSDMKLLHQFHGHARKGPVLAHLSEAVLGQIPSYVPNDKPTVPGHEVVIRVIEAGKDVKSVAVGKRYLVQADWRDLRTKGSNGAFGYNFEGGLQEYVLLDERTTIAADGTSYLMPVDEDKSASATALVEPWACVEQAFIHHERTTLAKGGTLLLVTSKGAKADLAGLDLSAVGKKLCLKTGDTCVPPAGFTCVDAASLAAQSVDDILFAGADAALFESVTPLLAVGGLCLIAQGGATFGREISTPVGRVHYGNIRFAGTTGARFAEALATVPATGEVRPGDHVHVVGAAGPMGQMAVIRLVSARVSGLGVEASDMNAQRLEVLRGKSEGAAKKTGTPLRLFNATTEKPQGPADYTMVMVPVAKIVAASIGQSRPRGIINIFAGIPGEVSVGCDLDAYCAKRLYFVGTSGSTMEDMNAVLRKVVAGDLDTNLSVAAVTGMGGAIEGLTAVKNGTMTGKILVYPQLGNFPLTTLEDLVKRFPSIAPKLDAGNWTKAAEEELLKVAGKK